MKQSYYESIESFKSRNFISSIGSTRYPSHFHHMIEMTYMKTGWTNSVINGKKYFADVDQILFVPEYYPHSYATSEDAQRMVLIPPENLKSEYDKVTDLTFPCVLPDREFNRSHILPVLEELYSVSRQAGDKNAEYLLCHALVSLVFARLYTHYRDVMASKDLKTETLANVLDYIENHYDDKITLPGISKMFGYNEFHFSKLFNGATGESLRNYVNAVRVRKFLEVYSSGKDQSTVLSTALSVGFESMPSFYRAFKSNYGMSPGEYFSRKNS